MFASLETLAFCYNEIGEVMTSQVIPLKQQNSESRMSLEIL